MERLTKTFTARAEDGRLHTVHLYTKYIETEDGELVEDVKALFTSDGERLSRVEKGVYP